MKALIILENGFEDVEALATVDILRRSKIEVITASIHSKNITTQSGHNIESQCLLKDLDISEFEWFFVFIKTIIV